MKTISIPIDKGYKFDSVNESEQVIKLVEIPKDIKERIENFDDVLAENGITTKDFALGCSELTNDEVAYKQLKLIVKTFNEGWLPDWTNSSQGKYVPWFKMASSSGVGFSCIGCVNWRTDSYVGSRLCFKSSDLAKHAGNLFLDIYKEFLTA